MIRIPLRDLKGNVKAHTIVDECDATFAQRRWCLNNGGYAKSSQGLLHRLIVGATDRLIPVDHINRDRLDNRRRNLRIATFKQNNLNRKKREGTSSVYLGVTRLEAKKKWGAYIHIDCNRICLGSHDLEIDAARQYDNYVLHHGLEHNLNGVDIPHDFLAFAPPRRLQPEDVGIKAQKSGSWVAQIRHGEYRKREVFPTKEEAVAARAGWCAESAQQKLERREERWVVYGGTARITISNTVVIVDAADVKNIFKFCWRITPDGYVACDEVGRMHRYLLQPAAEDIVDHINNNRSDNRRSNLRVVDHSVNNQNRALTAGGVRQHACGKYFGRIVRHKKVYTTPLVHTFEEALHARNAEAQRLYGKSARMQ